MGRKSAARWILAAGTIACGSWVWAQSPPKVWDIAAHTGKVMGLAISPTHPLVASGGFDGTLKIWSLSNGAAVGGWVAHNGIAGHLEYSRDGTLLLSCSGDLLGSTQVDNTARIWRASDGALLQVLSGHSGGVLSGAFSSDGELVATGDGNSTIRIWRVSDGALLKSFAQGFAGIPSLTFLPGDEVLAARDWAGDVVLWRLADQSVLATLDGAGSAVGVICLSRDGTRLGIIGSLASEVYRLADFQLLGRVNNILYSAHGGGFSGDGRTLIGCGFGNAKVEIRRGFDLLPLATYRDGLGNIGCFAMAADPRITQRYAVGTDTGRVMLLRNPFARELQFFP